MREDRPLVGIGDFGRAAVASFRLLDLPRCGPPPSGANFFGRLFIDSFHFVRSLAAEVEAQTIAGQIMFSVRPIFIGWIALLYQLPFQLFFTFWSAIFFGGLISSLHILPKNSPVPFVLFGGLAFLGVPLVTYFGKKLNYARTVYNFLEDRLEFEEGFFNINEKVIKFKDVEEVTLRKGIFQRLYGLGTIYLATHATGSFGRTNVFTALGFGNISASGVGVRDIRNPDETFARVRSIVDSQNV